MYKKITLLNILLIHLSCSIYCISQDVIIFKNGDEVNSKVLEVSTDQIKYKKWGNIDGPSYSLSKNEVFMIKYKNGTKDVFNSKNIVNTPKTTINDEDFRKNEAFKKIQPFVYNKLNQKVTELKSVNKTNGVMNNYFGQSIYTISFEVKLEFIKDGYLKGNGLEGYWRNSFYVYELEPDLQSNGQQFMYGIKKHLKGQIIVLGCEAQLKDTDNGYEIGQVSIKTIQDFGNKNENSSNNQTNSNNNDSKVSSKNNLEGYFNYHYSEGNYLPVGGLVYKSNKAIIKYAVFRGASIDSSPNEILLKSNNILSSNIYIDGFKEVNGAFNFTYSLCITLENGNVLELKENKIKKNKRDNPLSRFDFGFDYKTPPLINGTKSEVMYINFYVKDNHSEALLQGYYKFTIDNRISSNVKNIVME